MSDNLHVLESTSFSCDLSLSLASLLASSSLCDVTLVCMDGHLLAHKVILAATSSFFNSVFSLNQHNHPLIYLRGVKTDQMKAVLDFLYSGVVNVTEDGVEDFLEVANDLKIEGLMDLSSKIDESSCTRRTNTNNDPVVAFKPPTKAI